MSYLISSKKASILFIVCVLVIIGVAAAESKEPDQEKFMRAITQYIEKNMPWPSDQVRIEFLSQLPQLDGIPGKITCRVESRPKEDYLGDTSFNIRIFQNKIFLREESVRVRIEVLRKFVVSLNNLGKDTILSGNNLTAQKKWVREIPFNSVSSMDEALGKALSVSIRPNTEITRSMLKEILPVKKGRMVQVVLDNGMMKMMMNGLSEEDGAEGSIIKVRNLNSNKIIYARVIGQGRVKIDF